MKYVILILVAIVQLFPLYWLIVFSLKSNVEIFGENVIGLPQSWRFENYVEAVTTSEIGRYFGNSVFYSAATVIISGILTAMAAYAIGVPNSTSMPSFIQYWNAIISNKSRVLRTPKNAMSTNGKVSSR